MPTTSHLKSRIQATNSCSDADLLACADFILAPTDVNGNNPDPDRRPHVVNNSWGGGSGNTWYQPAVQAWRAAGIFPIFSAGNNGPGCDTLGSPGDYPESFNVAAFDISHNIADFSSRGPSILTDEWKPDVSAPGVNIRSAWPSGDSAYNILNGTSMASPHVAGLVALLWSSSDWLIGDIEGTEAAVRGTAIGVADGQCDFLMEPSSPAMVGVPNPVWGYGRINAYDATLWGDPGIIATPQKQRDFGFAEDVISYPVTLYNLGETLETVSLALGPHQWDAALSASSIDVPAGGNTAFYIYHTVPTGSTIGEESIDVEINWENGPIVVEVSTVNLSVDLQPDLPCPYEGTAFINENFNEGAFPPAGWTVVNNIGSCGWQSGSIAGNQNNTGGTGNFADANSDDCYPQDTELHTPVMDLSGVSEAFLEFKSDFNDYGGNDDGYVDISTNGGTDWTNLLHYEKQDYRGPRTETIDLTPYVGSENTIIRFRYVAPNWDWWWQVDDVMIYYATLPENGAVLCPEATTGKGCPGDGQIHTFSLWNFDPVQDFAMDYFAEAGDISGPGIVFVEADDSADFDITVNLPNLPDGEVIRYEIDAVGMDSGATAWASLDKTIGADEWFLNASMPFAAMDNPVVAYNGKIYAVGGYGAGGQVGIYDPATDTWTTGAIEPSPQIEYPNSAILGYNADGDATITLFPDTTSGVNALHVYNIDTDSWSTPPLPEGFPANGIWAHASVSDPANNVGYITGGASTPGGGNLTSLYRYHPDTHTVEALPVMTSPRDFHAAWLYDGMVCVAGGVNSNSTPLTSTQCFDLATETWGAENTDLPPLPTAQWGMASDTVCGVPMLSLGIIGGNVTTNTIGFDPLIGEWVSFDPAPEPAYRVGGAAIGGDFYVIGGSSGGFNPTSHNRMFLRCCAAEDCCLSVNPSELVLDTWQGSSNGPYACVTVTNACGDELEWNAITSEAWLEVSPGSGFDGDQACVEYTGSDLGSFEGTLTISATDCTPTSVAVNVDVNVWLPGDCNMDGVVSREEFNNARLMHSGRMPVEPCVDLNNDGIVSFSEFNAVYDAYRSNRLRR